MREGLKGVRYNSRMLIRIDILQFLMLKNATFPHSTPRRVEKITDEVVKYTHNVKAENLMLNLDIDLPNGELIF